MSDRRRFLFESLEPRILLSADLPVDVINGDDLEAVTPEDPTAIAELAAPDSQISDVAIDWDAAPDARQAQPATFLYEAAADQALIATLSRDGADLVLLDSGGNELARQAVAETTDVHIKGSDLDDELLLDFEQGSFDEIPVLFEGLGGNDLFSVDGLRVRDFDPFVGMIEFQGGDGVGDRLVIDAEGLNPEFGPGEKITFPSFSDVIVEYDGAEHVRVDNAELITDDRNAILDVLDRLANRDHKAPVLDEGVLEHLMSSGDFGTDLPLTGRESAMFDSSTLGELIDAGVVLQTLREDLFEWFQNREHKSDPITTRTLGAFLESWRDAITHNPATGRPALTDSSLGDLFVTTEMARGWIDVVAGIPELVFDMKFTTERTSDFLLKDAAELRDLGIEVEAAGYALVSGMVLDFRFGNEYGQADTAFTEITELIVSAEFDNTGTPFSRGAFVGFLDTDIEQGTIAYHAGAVIVLSDPTPSDGRLTLDDLDDLDTVVSDAAADAPEGTLDVDLPVTVVKEGFDPNQIPADGQVIAIDGDDFFDTGTTVLVPAQMKDFTLITANQLLGQMQQLEEWLDGVGLSNVLDFEFPLAFATSLGDAFGFGQAFREDVLGSIGDFDDLLLTFEALESDRVEIVGAPLEIVVETVKPSGDVARFRVEIAPRLDNRGKPDPYGISELIQAIQDDLDDERADVEVVQGEDERATGGVDNRNRIHFRQQNNSRPQIVRLPIKGAAPLTGDGFDHTSSLNYGTGIARFDSAQALALMMTDALREATGDPAIEILAQYVEDGDDTSLSYDLMWSHDFSMEVGADLAVDLGDLTDVITETGLILNSTATLDFAFGVKLRTSPPLVVAPPVFQPDEFGGGELSADASFTVRIFQQGQPDDGFIGSIDVTVLAGDYGDVDGLVATIQDQLDLAAFRAALSPDPDTRLGFSQDVELTTAMPVTADTDAPIDGRLDADLRVVVQVGAGSASVILQRGETDDNGDVSANPVIDLAADLERAINRALEELGVMDIAVAVRVDAMDDQRLVIERSGAGTDDLSIRFPKQNLDVRLGFTEPNNPRQGTNVVLEPVSPGQQSVAEMAELEAPGDGKLDADLRVMARVGNGDPVFVTLNKEETDDNGDPEMGGDEDNPVRDLADDLELVINQALGGTGIAVAVVVGEGDDDFHLVIERSDTSTETLVIGFPIADVVAENAGNRITLYAPGITVAENADSAPEVFNRRLEIDLAIDLDPNAPPNTAYSELGLLSSPIPFNGRMAQDIEFDLEVETNTGEILSKHVVLPAAVTAGNESIDDLIADLYSVIFDPVDFQVEAVRVMLDGGDDTNGSMAPAGNRVGFRTTEDSEYRLIRILPSVAGSAAVRLFGMDDTDEMSARVQFGEFFLEGAILTGSARMNADGITGGGNYGFIAVNLKDTTGMVSADAAIPILDPLTGGSLVSLRTLVNELGAGVLLNRTLEDLGFAGDEAAGTTVTASRPLFDTSLVALGFDDGQAAGAAVEGVAELTATSSLPADGRLAEDVSFELLLDGSRMPVSVLAESTADNAQIMDLVNDVNDALIAAKIFVVQASANTNDELVLTIDFEDDPTLSIHYQGGRLERSVKFVLVVDGTEYGVHLTAMATEDNGDADPDLLGDIDEALAEAGVSSVEAGLDGNLLTLTSTSTPGEVLEVRAFSVVPEVTAQGEPLVHGLVDLEVIFQPSIGQLTETPDPSKMVLDLDVPDWVAKPPQLDDTSSPEGFRVGVSGTDLSFYDTMTNFTVDDVAGGLTEVVGYLDRIMGTGDFASTGAAIGEIDSILPLLNVNLTDLLGVATDFEGLIDFVVDNAAGSIQTLENSLKDFLGLSRESELVKLMLDLGEDGLFGDDGVALRVDLTFETGFEAARTLNLDLETLVAKATAGSDTGNLQDVLSMIGVSSSGDLSLDVSGTLRLSLGIQLGGENGPDSGSTDQDPDDQEVAAAAGVEALGYLDGDEADGTLTARSDVPADRLVDQDIIFELIVNGRDDDAVRIKVEPGEDTKQDAQVTLATELGTGEGELEVRTNSLSHDLEIELRDGTTEEIDLDGALTVGLVIARINLVDDLLASLVAGRIHIVDSSQPATSDPNEDTGSPVFLKSAENTGPREGVTEFDSMPLDFWLRVGPENPFFRVQVDGEHYTNTTDDTDSHNKVVRRAWLADIREAVRLAMVGIGQLGEPDPASVDVTYVSGKLAFGSDRTLTIRSGTAGAKAFKVENAAGSHAAEDLGIELSGVEGENESIIVGSELRAEVSTSSLVDDLNMALALVDSEGLPTELGELLDSEGIAEIEAGKDSSDRLTLTARDAAGNETTDRVKVRNVEIDRDGFIHPFIYDGIDGTALSLSAEARGDNLDFTAQVGPFGFFVIDGEASLQVAFNVFLVDDDGNGRHYLLNSDEVYDFPDIEDSFIAVAQADLPLYFPTEATPVGDPNILGITVDLLKFLRGQDNSVEIRSPDLTSFPTPTLIGMLSNPEYVIDGLDALLLTVQEAVDDIVLGVNLPLVGDQLVDPGQFIQDFREDVLAYLSSKLREGGLNPVNVVRESLYNVFGPQDGGNPEDVQVLGFEPGSNGDGSLTADMEPLFGTDGKIEHEARFVIIIGNDRPELVVVDPDNTDTGFAGLVAGLQASLDARGLGDRLRASLTSDDKLQLTGIGDAANQVLRVSTAGALKINIGGLSFGALGLLVDTDGDGFIDVGDVGMSGFGLTDTFGQFELELGQEFVFNQPLSFDIGLDALGLALDADVEVFFDWNLDFAFGIDQNIGFYFVTGDTTSELTINGGAELVGNEVAELLGFRNRDTAEATAGAVLVGGAKTEVDALRGLGEPIVFRLTVNDRGLLEGPSSSPENTHAITVANDFTTLQELVDRINVAIPQGLRVVASIQNDATDRIQFAFTDADALSIRGGPASIEGTLGFLMVNAVDIGVAGIDLGFDVDLMDPSSSPDGKLGFSEMIATSTTFDDLIQATFNGEASLQLGVEVDFSGTGIDASLLPRVTLDVMLGDVRQSGTAYLPWTFANVNLNEVEGEMIGSTPAVLFEDIELDVGSFISDFAGPFLSDIAGVLEPLDFLLDRDTGLLYRRLPVISDLMGETINLKTLAEFFDTEGKITPFLNAVEELYHFVSLVTDAAVDAEMSGGNIVLNFGSLNLGDLRGMEDLGEVNLNDAHDKGGMTNVDDIADASPSKNNPKAGKAKSFTKSLTKPGKGAIAFPIVSDPSNILNLLLGNADDVTLVTYDLPSFGFDFEYLQRFPIYPPLFATLRGYFSATIDLGFGYDATGLAQFKDTHNPLDLLNGFFISDLDFATGVDIPEITLTGGLAAGASLDIIVASAGVEGGIEPTIYLDLSDPNFDGKVRLGEMAANLFLNNFNPIAIFDPSGKVDAFLRAYVEVLFGLWSAEYEIARVTLVEFDIQFDRPPLLAQEIDDGVLQLNIGENSKSRFHGNLADNGETIFARTDGDNTVRVWGMGVPELLGQRFTGVKKIVARGGDGNDLIDLSEVGNKVEVEIWGEVGNDKLIGGRGKSVIHGGEGNDHIEGRGGQDELYGGVGNDTILGGDHKDLIDGGSGNDTLDGGKHDDRFVFSGEWGLDNVDPVDPDDPGNDTWDFSDVRSDLTVLIGADDFATAETIVYLGQSREVAQSLVTHDGFEIGKILGGRGSDRFEIYQTAAGGPAVELNGQGGSDTYVMFTDPLKVASAKVVLYDVGDLWNTDRAVFFGSDADDAIDVDQLKVTAGTNPFMYGDDGQPDDADLAAVEEVKLQDDSVGEGKADTEFKARIISKAFMSATTAGVLDRVARFEIGVGDEESVLVGIAPDDVGGDHTLDDLIVALNDAFERVGLADRVVAEKHTDVRYRLITVEGTREDPGRLTVDAVVGGSGIDILQVKGRDGDDVVVVESTGERTSVSIEGQLGNDRVFVGGLLDSEETLDEIRGSGLTGPLVAAGGQGIDRLFLVDTGDTDDNTGFLTEGKISGLDMQVDVEYIDMSSVEVHLGAGSDRFDVLRTIDGTTTLHELGGDAPFLDGSTTVVGNAGDDTFNVGTDSFRDPDDPGTLNTINGAVLIFGGEDVDTLNTDDTADGEGVLVAGNPIPADVARHGVLSADATFLLTVGAGAPVEVTVIRKTGTEMDGAADGEPGMNPPNTSLQDLENDINEALGVAGLSDRVVASIDEETNLLSIDGGQGELLTVNLEAGDPAETDLGLVDGQTVAGYNDGTLTESRLIGLGMTLRGFPEGTAVDAFVEYGGIEFMNVDLGSGSDRFNVQGTLPVTGLRAGDGDDLIYVSSEADLRKLDGYGPIDGDLAALHDEILHGSLDLVSGALDIDAGEGRNTLGISDRTGDISGDAPVRITSGVVEGLAPAPIAYRATGGDYSGQGFWTLQDDIGLFGRGINIYGSSTGNTFEITSIFAGDVRDAPFGATLTTVFAGDGDDVVTATVEDTPAALLVIRGQDGDDVVDASGSTSAVTVFGDGGRDDLTTGSSEDLIFGDFGRLYYLRPPQIAADEAFDVVLGGAPNPADIEGVVPDDDFLTFDVFVVKDEGPGSNDVLRGREGTDILIGGGGNDRAYGKAGNDVLLGDFGRLAYSNGELVLIATSDPRSGGNDTLVAGSGFDIVLGGTGSDKIFAGGGNDLVFGDHGRVQGMIDASLLPLELAERPFTFTAIDTQNTDGGAGDKIFGGAGDDIILGQQGGDTLYGGIGDDDIIGGHNVAGGHDGADTISGGRGDDVIAGDNATILRSTRAASARIRILSGSTIYDDSGAPQVTADAQRDPRGTKQRDIELFDHDDAPLATTFGADHIAGNAGDDMIFGQFGDDALQGDGSTAIDRETLATLGSLEDLEDGDDYIEGNGGNDLIFGNLGQDDLVGGSSSLFGLDTAAERSDGADTIFGGAGTRAARNDPGDASADGHARDADLIVGDNANVYRLVGTNGSASGEFLAFTYDGYGEIKIVPRAFEILDYVPGGAGGDRGAGDLLYGEAGDDIVHGATGNDVLFGDGQDDDLYGGSGGDRLYGGTGEDGILGDDGRIMTRRNGLTETLYGIDMPNTPETLELPGPFTSVEVNLSGRLTKAVVLDAYELGGQDIIFGGLGDDFLHGGAGDDAISGSEAMPGFYTADAASGDSDLGYDPETRELADYDADNPRLRIDGFHLEFEATDETGARIDDGADRLFGDLGNDWLVGGTGVDHMFGGMGDDVLDADDNHDTNGGLNDATDPDPYAEGDIAFGGGGLDVLIANTGRDRLFDWSGEFNSYIVPFSPFGAPTVNRSPAPHIVEFLEALGEAGGADRGREGPQGELGVVTHDDPEWRDQHGSPRDPQPGNGKGRRDTQGRTDDMADTSGSSSTDRGRASTEALEIADPAPDVGDTDDLDDDWIFEDRGSALDSRRLMAGWEELD